MPVFICVTFICVGGMCLDVHLVFGGLKLTSDWFLRMAIHNSFTKGNISMLYYKCFAH